MSNDKARFWQAYLDGELSVSEAAEFEAELDDEERQLLASEMGFESALAEKLSLNATCPDEVWDRTRALIEAQQTPRRTMRRWYYGAATFAAAASIAFILAVYAPMDTSPSSAVVMAAQTVEELAAASETPGDRESVHRYLLAHGVRLDLREPMSLHMAGAHPHIELVGVRTEMANGEPVVEMLFACCGKPVKVLMVKQGTQAALDIGQAAGAGHQVRATRLVGNYLTAVVSDHSAHGLLDIFEGQDAAPANHSKV